MRYGGEDAERERSESVETDVPLWVGNRFLCACSWLLPTTSWQNGHLMKLFYQKVIEHVENHCFLIRGNSMMESEYVWITLHIWFLIEKGHASIQSKTKTKPKPNWNQSESKLRPKALQTCFCTGKVTRRYSKCLQWHQIESKPVPLL